MTGIVISPHLDDAVLSFGGAIAADAETREPSAVTICTVLAGTPPEWFWPTPFDNASGFDRSTDAAVARRWEDREACEALDVEPLHLPFLDGQYGISRPENEIVDLLRAHMRHAEFVAVPLGLAHPDHRLVAKCCRQAMTDLAYEHRRTLTERDVTFLERPFLVYADLPAAKLWPSHVPGALRGWERAGWVMERFDWPVLLDQKRAAWECYASQLRFPELAWENVIGEYGWLTTFEG